MDEILQEIIKTLKGKTVQEAINILFKVMDKIKANTEINQC